MRAPAVDPGAATRNVAIDRLRGLAIGLVVFHHLGIRIPLGETALARWLPEWLLGALNDNGSEAVFVFFVISGFLITTHSLRRWGSLASIEPVPFYRLRIARILPTLAALVVVLSLLHLAGVEEYRIHRPDQSLPGAIASAFGLYLNLYEGRTGYLPGGWDVLWSLSIEEAFYVLFPLVCLTIRSRYALVAGLIALAVSLPWAHGSLRGDEIWQEKAYLPGAAAIAAGILAALAVAQGTASAGLARVLRVIGAGGLASVLVVEGAWIRVVGEGVWLVLTASTAIFLYASAGRVESGGTDRWGIRALGTWGRRSYEIYLSHMFVVFALVRVARATGTADRSGWIWYLVAPVICGLLGYAVERLISEPARRWLRGPLHS